MARSRRAINGNGSTYKLLFFSALGLVIVGSIWGFYFINDNPSPQLDAAFCPINSSQIGKSVSFVFDTTEPLSPSQYLDTQNRVKNYIKNLNEFDSVRFYSVNSSETSGISRLKISLGDGGVVINHFCMPRVGGWEQSPAQKMLASLMPELLVTEFVNAVNNDLVQNKSPIIDALRYVASDDDRIVPIQEVVVISDMIEHSKYTNMYRSGWYENEYLKNKQKFVDSRPVYRDGTKVIVLSIMRPKTNVQDNKWLQFWLEMISGTNQVYTVPVEFIKITGSL